MATLKQVDGRYRARFFTPDGQERRVTFKSNKAKVVQAIWQKLEGSLALGDYRDEDFAQYWVRKPQVIYERQEADRAARERSAAKEKERSVTFRDFANEWLERKKRNLYPSGYRDYRSCLDKYLIPFFGDKPIASITTRDIEELKAWMYRPIKRTIYKRDAEGKIVRGKRHKKLRETVEFVPKPSRINNVLIPLKTMMRDAYDLELLTRLPKIKKDKELPAKQICPLSEEEVRLFLAKTPVEYFATFAFAFATGVRVPGELSALKVGDVDFRIKKVRIGRTFSAGELRETTKTGHERWVDLSDDIITILKAEIQRREKDGKLKSDDFLFVNSWGSPIDGTNLRHRVWAEILADCGLAYRPLYNTRHTYASIMLMKGNSVLYISQQLGHTNAHTTLKYYSRFIPSMGAIMHLSLAGTAGEADPTAGT